MPQGTLVAPPPGYVSFCARDPKDCEQTGAQSAVLDDHLWQLLWRVNTAWNDAIKPLEDNLHYGRYDYWTIPSDGYGDCEDYALGKRQSLIRMGFPSEALRLAVVRRPSGEAHVVLTVATDRGDYVLDNLNRAVLPWNETDYTWIARQRPGETKWAGIAPQSGSDLVVTAALSAR